MDREKVIKAAEICLRYIDDGDCPTECPYFDLCTQYEKRVVFQPLIRDALELLKEQEAIKPTINEYGEAYCICGENVGIIPNNKNLPSVRTKYCPECGRRMKWE